MNIKHFNKIFLFIISLILSLNTETIASQVIDLSVVDNNKLLKLRGLDKRQAPKNKYKSTVEYQFINALYKGKLVFEHNVNASYYQILDFDASAITKEEIIIPRAVTIYIKELNKDNNYLRKKFALEDEIIFNFIEPLSNKFKSNVSEIEFEDENYILNISKSLFSNPKFYFDVTSSGPYFFPYTSNSHFWSPFLNLEKYLNNFSEAISTTQTTKVELTPYIYVYETATGFEIQIYLNFAHNNAHIYGETFSIFLNKKENETLKQKIKDALLLVDFGIDETKKRIGYE